MSAFPRIVGLCVLLLSTAAAAQSQTAQIDGFTVTSLPLPPYPEVPVASGISYPTTVLYLVKSSTVGASPYSGEFKDKAGFLSIQQYGKARFSFYRPVDMLNIVWGSIGMNDSITFYSGQTVTGVLLGSDVAGVFGSDTSPYLSIKSPVTFTRVTLAAGECCFEFANLSASPD